MIGSDLAGFTFEIGAEVDNRVAGVLGELDGGVERSLWARDQFEMRARKGGITLLAAFVPGIIERAADRIIDLKAVFGDDRARVGECGRIRHCRSGGDCRRLVTRNVRYGQRHDLGALGGARESPALDPRQVLANGVDLADRRAGAEQRPRHLQFLHKGHTLGRRDPIGRAAARQQHQHQIVDLGLLRQTQGLFGSL